MNDFEDKIPLEIRLAVDIEEKFQRKYENELYAARMRFEAMKKKGVNAYSYGGDALMQAIELSMLTGNFTPIFDAYEIEKSMSMYRRSESDESRGKHLNDKELV